MKRDDAMKYREGDVENRYRGIYSTTCRYIEKVQKRLVNAMQIM